MDLRADAICQGNDLSSGPSERSRSRSSSSAIRNYRRDKITRPPSRASGTSHRATDRTIGRPAGDRGTHSASRRGPCKPPRFLTVAACGGLEPAPDGRIRGTYPHLLHSIAPPSVRSWHTLVHVPAAANVAAPTATEFLSQSRREFRLPIPHRLVAEHDAADQEHLGEIAQAELVAQAPEHHERDDVARILRPVQQAGAALVELPAALAAAEPAISLSRALWPLRRSRRTAALAPHPSPAPGQKGRDATGSGCRPPESRFGASPDRTPWASSCARCKRSRSPFTSGGPTSSILSPERLPSATSGRAC
jgi:hypothetical protein